MGYGIFFANRQTYIAYRLAYELTYGPIPVGFVVRHRCAVKTCCNPSHLVLGTQQENLWDREARKRYKKKPGELFTYEDAR